MGQESDLHLSSDSTDPQPTRPPENSTWKHLNRHLSVLYKHDKNVISFFLTFNYS